ncbi:MAG: glycosyltransferase family 2 protein [Candidatus Heimdallarchaeaceae archaeon]
MKKIYGNIICQNSLPEILRTIESLCPICDEIYICDSFSTDGTWEWLNNVKDVYHLKLFQHQYKSMVKQRNWLLKRTPINAWVVSIDHDEEICNPYSLKEAIESIKIGRNIAIRINMVTMIDITHCSDFFFTSPAKLFFHKEGVSFGQNDYHAIPTVAEKEEWEVFDLPHFIAIKHYAFLDRKGCKERCKRLKNNKDAGKSEYEFWCTMKHKIIDLPEEFR